MQTISVYMVWNAVFPEYGKRGMRLSFRYDKICRSLGMPMRESAAIYAVPAQKGIEKAE